MIIENQRTVKQKTTATSSDAVVDDPCVGETTSGIEVLDWKLTDSKKSKSNSELSSSSIVCEVEVRLVAWSSNLFQLTSWEPALELKMTNKVNCTNPY